MSVKLNALTNAPVALYSDHVITQSRTSSPRAADSLERTAGLLKVLAQPVRLALIDELRHGEVCVCDLATRTAADRSNVSRHLSVMLRAGIVFTRRVRQQVFYRLNLPCVLHVIDCVRASQRGKGGTFQQCCNGGGR